MCLMKCLSQDTSDEVFKSPGYFHVHRLFISGLLVKACVYNYTVKIKHKENKKIPHYWYYIAIC